MELSEFIKLLTAHQITRLYLGVILPYANHTSFSAAKDKQTTSVKCLQYPLAYRYAPNRILPLAQLPSDLALHQQFNNLLQTQVV